MIADTGLLATSPWHSDPVLYKEFLKNGLLDVDTDYTSLGGKIERSHNFKKPKAQLGSCGTSVASSECSDDPYLDVEGDNTGDVLFSLSEDHDLLASSIMNLLEQPTDTQTLPGFSWTDQEIDLSVTPTLAETSLDISLHMPLSPEPMRKRTHSQSFTENKPWSRMSHLEQVETIEKLTRTISDEMGLREQMEVIRIINPVASVSPTDTEFVIELDWLSDEKLQRVREYVKQHNRGSSSSSSCSDTGSEPTTPHKKNSNGLSQRERRSQLKAERQRQRKEYRQMMKEKRSGLFQREEVLALTVAKPDEEEEVDVDVLE